MPEAAALALLSNLVHKAVGALQHQDEKVALAAKACLHKWRQLLISGESAQIA